MEPHIRHIIKLKQSYLSHARDRPVLTLDNATCHTGANLEQLTAELPCTILFTPPRSPDIHKVVEHAVSRMKCMLKAWVRQGHITKLTDKLWLRIERAFYEETVNTHGVESVTADMATMNDTLHAIIEADGDWAPRKYR